MEIVGLGEGDGVGFVVKIGSNGTVVLMGNMNIGINTVN